MKGVKNLLFALLIMLYTSSWWAASIWGADNLRFLWVIPSIMTFIFIVVIYYWLLENWGNDK